MSSEPESNPVSRRAARSQSDAVEQRSSARVGEPGAGIPVSIIFSGLSAALVGFAGSVAIVLEAARSVGADSAQSASWVIALCLGIAVTSFYLSVRHRMPVITAWSTPGAALIASDGAGIGLESAVGVFLIAGLLVMLTGVIKPFGRLVEALPKPLAAAMLAGIIVPFCIAVAKAVPVVPMLVLPLIVVFFVAQIAKPFLAVPIVFGLGIGITWLSGLMAPTCCSLSVALPQWVAPEFNLGQAMSLAIPLFIVTMASQNLAGLAVLKSDDFAPSPASCFSITGFVSLLSAPFGGHSVCLAAITASMVTGPLCHPDRERRWLVGPAYAAVYLVFAVLSETLVELLLALPAALITTFVGLALLGPLSGSLRTALAGDARQTQAALVTFLVAASGVSFLGLGAAPWSLLAGLGLLALYRLYDHLAA